MEVDPQERKIITRALDEWSRNGQLTEEQRSALQATIKDKHDDRQQIARYFFIIAVSCMLLAFSSIFIDDKFLETLKKYFSLSNIFIAVLTTILTVIWFYVVKRRKDHFTEFTYEVFMIVGALGTLTAIVYYCKDYTNDAHYTVFLLLATAALFVESLLFRSVALWTCALLSFCGWFGAFTTWQSKDNLFLGMNYPTRFVLLGLVLIGFSHLQKSMRQLLFTQRITYLFGLITFFTAMWGLSIFGNYNHWDEWIQVRQTHVLVYGFLFAVTGFAALFFGIRQKDDLTRDFGILFLLLNLYTRYFEYFWNTMHKGIFFLVLAASFWLLGKWLERYRKKMADS
jgi:undecaprenyl pyrophosphate phosphatase UppP